MNNGQVGYLARSKSSCIGSRHHVFADDRRVGRRADLSAVGSPPRTGSGGDEPAAGDDDQEGTPVHVAVLGAGAGGLAVAYEWASRGSDVSLYSHKDHAQEVR